MKEIPNNKKRFKKVYIEITNVCNLKCDFCPAETRSFGYMSVIDFRKIIEEVKPFTNYVNFHLKGEPLLHPELGKFLEICSIYKEIIVFCLIIAS